MYLEYSLEQIYVSVEEALADYDHRSPDIVFIEVSQDDGCGIECIRRFRKKDPNVKIISIFILSLFLPLERYFIIPRKENFTPSTKG